eukprot:Hpha_TRINITY_DN22980_c0_g1::TRINITY_DN22980_c0_g1_i1::g.154089::m.154089
MSLAEKLSPVRQTQQLYSPSPRASARRSPPRAVAALHSPDAGGLATELSRVRRAARAVSKTPPQTLISPVSPLHQTPLTSQLDSPPPAPPHPPMSLTSSTALPAAAAARDGAVGVLHRAIESRNTRVQQQLAAKDRELGHQSTLITQLESRAEEKNARHAAQVAGLEGEVQALRGLMEAAAAGVLGGGGEEVQGRLLNGEAAKLAMRRMQGEVEAAQARVEVAEQGRAVAEEQLRLALQALDEGREAGEVVALRAELSAAEGRVVAAAWEAEGAVELVAQEQHRVKDIEQRHLGELGRLQDRLESQLLVNENLRAQMNAKNGRQAQLEARVAELELSRGVNEENAVSMERMRVCGEVERMKDRHREHSIREAEQLGTLRGLLTAAEARAELAEARAASLEEQLAQARVASENMHQSLAALNGECELKATLGEAEATRAQKLDRRLTEARLALDRQGGLVQAAQQRALAGEKTNSELRELLYSAEQEAAEALAEAGQARLTADRQNAELQRLAFENAAAEERALQAKQRCMEVEGEAASTLRLLEVARSEAGEAKECMLRMQHDTSHRGALLRAQLQADAEAAASVRFRREAGEFEARILECELELHTACNRRHTQACKAAESLRAASLRIMIGGRFVRWLQFVRVRRVGGLMTGAKSKGEELVAAERRELLVREELDEAVRGAKAEGRRFAAQRLRSAAVLQSGAAARFALSCLRRWVLFAVHRAAQSARLIALQQCREAEIRAAEGDAAAARQSARRAVQNTGTIALKAAAEWRVRARVWWGLHAWREKRRAHGYSTEAEYERGRVQNTFRKAGEVRKGGREEGVRMAVMQR